MRRTIGILALQGDFARHQMMLRLLNVETVLVKRVEDLSSCVGLIIPGGESTTLTKLIDACNLYEPICEFGGKYPLMGTCAGAIMVSSVVDDPRVKPLGLIDISISRNAYGRQIDSFTTQVDMAFLHESPKFATVFIRAPKIRSVGSHVQILMELQGNPIMVQEDNVLALTFHPELTDDPRIHQYFLEHFFPHNGRDHTLPSLSNTSIQALSATTQESAERTRTAGRRP
jgi:5'-phosphate synthase pdxT subunit